MQDRLLKSQEPQNLLWVWTLAVFKTPPYQNPRFLVQDKAFLAPLTILLRIRVVIALTMPNLRRRAVKDKAKAIEIVPAEEEHQLETIRERQPPFLCLLWPRWIKKWLPWAINSQLLSNQRQQELKICKLRLSNLTTKILTTMAHRVKSMKMSSTSEFVRK